MILTPAQQKAFAKGLAACNEVRPFIEWLEQVASVYPPVAEQVEALKVRMQHLNTLCEVAIEADRAVSGGA